MRYELHAPMIITSRLMPGVRIGDGSTLSIAAVGQDAEQPERIYWEYYIDSEDGEIHHAADISTVMWERVANRNWGKAAAEALRTLAAFLSHEAEQYRSNMAGHAPEDGWTFSEAVAAWAYHHEDELDMLSLDEEDE